jgi:predicted solute-binding protein
MYMLVVSFYFLFSRTTSSIGRMMMMIVVLRVRVSHLKRKWQHSPTLS